METVGSCNLCGGTRFELVERYHREGEVYPLVQCETCGLSFLERRPAPSEILRFYESYGHPGYSQPWSQRVASKGLRWCIDGRNGVGSSVKQAASRLMEPLWVRPWRRNLAKYHAEDAPVYGSLLDVGCAHAVWMAAQSRWGFTCVGCEPDPVAAEYARSLGFEVFAGDLLAASYAPERFDMVHFNHVLEHTHDPASVLREAVRVLKPGGVVVAVVPNRSGLVGRAFREVEDVPRHLFAFSPANMIRYFSSAGLRMDRIWTETPDVYGMYSHLYHASLRFARDAGVEVEVAQRFWLSDRRRREFKETVRFADAIGAGVQIVAVGAKPEGHTGTETASESGRGFDGARIGMLSSAPAHRMSVAAP